MKHKILKCAFVPEPERSEILRSDILPIVKNTITVSSKKAWIAWFIETISISKNLKCCDSCFGMVHFIGTFEDIPLFRCVDCGAFFFIHEYNILEKYIDKQGELNGLR